MSEEANDSQPTTTPNPMDIYVENLSKVKGNAKTQKEILLKKYCEEMEDIRLKYSMSPNDFNRLSFLLKEVCILESRV